MHWIEESVDIPVGTTTTGTGGADTLVSVAKVAVAKARVNLVASLAVRLKRNRYQVHGFIFKPLYCRDIRMRS